MSNIATDIFGAQAENIEAYFKALQLKTHLADSTWGLGNADWDADLDAGTLTFTEGNKRIHTTMQVLGTYNTQDGTFLWAWAHPSVPHKLAQHALKVKAFAEAQGLEALLTPQLTCSELDCWKLTALAVHLSGAQCAYRGPAEPALVYMTFDNVEIRQRGLEA